VSTECTGVFHNDFKHKLRSFPLTALTTFLSYGRQRASCEVRTELLNFVHIQTVFISRLIIVIVQFQVTADTNCGEVICRMWQWQSSAVSDRLPTAAARV
jgi:hypothetical protein